MFLLSVDDKGPKGSLIVGGAGAPEEPDTVLGPIFLEEARNLSP